MPNLKKTCYTHQQLLAQVVNKGGVTSRLLIIWAKTNYQHIVAIGSHYTKGYKGSADNSR